MENVVNPQPGFWRGKRVLLTGHTGFKGAWTMVWLESLGAHVTGFALDPPSCPNLFELIGTKTVTDLRCDIRDPRAVLEAVTQARPEIVIHMAAQALVRPSYADPIATYAANIMGTVHILDAVRRTGTARAVVVVTSDKCYENREWLWPYRESEPMGGHDPYSSSKACAELVTTAFRCSFFSSPDTSAVASVRAGNAIGGGDWAQDRIVPDCIRACVTGRPVTIRYPNAVRPWQHVLEPVAGYLLLAERLWTSGAAFAEAWNFGPRDDDIRPVSHIVATLGRLWGREAAWHGVEAVSTPQLHEAGYLRIDPTKARARLMWRPRLTVDEALAWTAEWYRRQKSDVNARTLCLEQIERYQGLEVLA